METQVGIVPWHNYTSSLARQQRTKLELCSRPGTPTTCIPISPHNLRKNSLTNGPQRADIFGGKYLAKILLVTSECYHFPAPYTEVIGSAEYPLFLLVVDRMALRCFASRIHTV